MSATAPSSHSTQTTAPATPIPASTSTFQLGGAAFLSPGKRARSPDIAVTTDQPSLSSLPSLGQPPSKSATSPSTRERSQIFSTTTAAETSPTRAKSNMLQQSMASTSLANGNSGQIDEIHATTNGSNLQSSGGLPRSPNSNSTKTHQRAATTGSTRIFSNSSNNNITPGSPFAKPADPYNSGGSSSASTQQQLQQGFRAPTHSGSTTSGFSGSTGSSYDSVISLDGGSLPPGTAGLGMIVQGPAYTSPSPGQGLQYGSSSSSVYQQIPSSQPQAGYYAQPYGYQPVASSSSTIPQQGTFTPFQLQNYASAGQSHNASYSDNLRRSIAGQSTGGSSYQSGASNSPMVGMHRRSDDLSSAFLSPVLPDSAQASYTPLTDINSSPASGKQSQQQQQQQQGQGAWSNVPVQVSHQVQQLAPNMVYTASDASSVAPPYYAPSAQDYQSVVDQIMSQSRKGTDYGMHLGDFEMLDTLGTGTFGRVLLVRLVPKPGQQSPLPAGMPHYFAMKVLTKTEVVRLKQVEHINCERSILGAVDHPGIVNLFCTFQDSLNIYMLLEFVQGGELFSHLRRAVRFSADVSRFYAANIISVLEYLHSRNLIYRDLKPENLLLDHQGYLKVTDFGFAKYVPDRTFTLCGTPEYLAPEIINSAGHGKAADWWAFGVLLFEMLCGYPPFFDESPWGIYEKILAGNFSFPPHVDPVARDLIRRLLSSDRSKRLGNLRNGAQDVKSHQWFEGVDWNAVERRIIPAPIIPRIKSTSDSQNFERYPSIPIESLPGLARAKGYQVKEDIDPYEHMFTNF